ncbi:MAG TPA: M1 family aminopeptidase [Longimicrobiales bacterium]|nr:M1 family aminopeptidase [Longimicrobiales bacterium]
MPPTRRIALTAATLTLLAASAAVAQNAPQPRSDSSVFRRLALPAPNEFRSASGKPGPRYWQQRADYRIQATLDTARQTVSGTETIHYTNNSPDTLTFVWLQVEQNLYRPGSLGSAVFPAEGRWGARNFEGGIDITTARTGGADIKPYIHDTTMRLDLPRPLPPGQSVDLELGWSFKVPEHGSDRMAREGKLYEIAQWYPRMAVYDDVNGWNTDPYLGQGEFYLEYGDYDVSLTVPAGYVVAATGTLQNAEQVLTAAQRQRLAQAAGSAKQVAIIAPGEVGKAMPKKAGTQTWHFTASGVHDFAWAGSPDFLWDAMSQGGVVCHAFYQPNASASWRRGADSTCFSIDEFSNRWFKYPWPQATSVAGPVGGMEYPMFVMVSAQGEEKGTFGVIAHEHGHEWFPMIVGSNERRYAWMDEGFNTFIDEFANDRRFPGGNTPAMYVQQYQAAVDRGMEQPLMTPPDRIAAAALGVVGYRKPGMVLNLLRDKVLGPDLFDAAFRAYIQRWAFKHPTPADFFRTMEDVSGRDLAWFFREWFYTTDVLDQAVDGVVVNPAVNGQSTVRIRLANKTPLVMPVDLELVMDSGQKQTVSLPVEVWYGGPTYEYTTTVPGHLVRVTIDPKNELPDQNRQNNAWSAAKAAQ